MLARMSDEVVYESQPQPPEAAVQQQTPWFRRPLVAGLLGLVVGAGAVGGVWAASRPGAPATFTMRGVLDLAGDHDAVPPENKDCAGIGGYDDIAKGAAVTVYDAGGKVVAAGALGAGHYADPVAYSGDCLFSLVVPDVPKGVKFYQVEITHRGKLTASVAEAESGSFGATLGN